MAESSKNMRSSKSGGRTFLRILIKVVILGFLSAYAAATILVHCPADLSKIRGYGSQGENSEDILGLLSSAVKTRNQTVAIREEEINNYIAAHLEATQEGYSGDYVDFKGVWVDFAKDKCVIYMEREAFGRRSTVGLELKISREGDKFLTQFTAAHFGRIKLPSGFLLLVKHSFDRLVKDVFPEEIELIFQMNQIKFDEDRMVLDPRFPK